MTGAFIASSILAITIILACFFASKSEKLKGFAKRLDQKLESIGRKTFHVEHTTVMSDAKES